MFTDFKLNIEFFTCIIMRLLKQFAFSVIFVVLFGCTTIQRTAHMYSNEASLPLSFKYKDGGSSVYYAFTIGDALQPETVIFFYGGTGCPSWKSVMPGYVSGLTVSARVFVLNKRFVADRSIGMFGCGEEFQLANNPSQWISDYSEFITAQMNSFSSKPRNVVLVGVSEGAIVATKVAAEILEITHLAIIGSGGYSMRKSLATLAQREAIWFDVEAGWNKILSDPRSIEKDWYGNPYRWWSDIMDIDPLPDFLKLNIPIIIGMGEKDESVPVESALFLDAKFKEAGKNNLTLKVYQESDHRLNGNGVSHRDEFFAELSRLLQRTHDIAARRDVPKAARRLSLH
ncbi:MAG: alpha/beta hydrolase [Methylobacter sp.]